MARMYVTKAGSLYVMRQTRYASTLTEGKEHPHDICAFACSIEEMHAMCDQLWPDADYRAAQQEQQAKGT